MLTDAREISNIQLITRKAHTALKLVKYNLNPVELQLKKSISQQPVQISSVDFDERNDILDTFRKLINDNGRTIPSKTICDCFYDEKIREKTICLLGLGKNVRGNLQYILNVLNYNEKFNDYRIYVRTAPETDDIVKEYIENNHWVRTETVLENGKYSEIMESAQYLLTEVFFPESWVKKPGQTYINIWHGTPLKKVGLAKNQRNKHKSGVIQKNFIDADYLLYPNNYTKNTMLNSYKISSLISGKTLMLGYPRTGGMLAAHLAVQTEVRKILAPNDEKIYVYMPTFRGYLSNDEEVAIPKKLLDYLDENLRDNQILYVNLHHRLSDSIDYNEYTHIKKFPPTIDSYKILAASEALITDYSSVFFDYLALRKQIILHIEDYATYRKKRGTYMNLLELPFDKAVTGEEVLNALNRGKTYDDTEIYQEFCSYDSADNAEKLCQLFSNDESTLLLNTLPQDNKFHFLIYSDVFQKGVESQFISDFIKRYNKKHYKIYLSCDMNLVVPNDSLYSIMDKTPVIGTEQEPHLSAMGIVLKKLYLEGKLTFSQIIDYLKYDYTVMGMRMYGRARFDTVVIYDVINPDTVLALTYLPSPKILFLTDHMLQELQSGNFFFKDALCHAAKHCNSIFAGSKSGMKIAQKMLDDSIGNKIHFIDLSKEL